MIAIRIGNDVFEPTKGLYGTDTILKTLNFVFDTQREIIAAQSDKKISLLEAIGLIDNVRSAADIANSWKILVKEIADLDESEKDKIVGEICSQQRLARPKAEEWYALGIDLIQNLLQTIYLTSRAAQLFKKN
jgi:hypothetical protein